MRVYTLLGSSKGPTPVSSPRMGSDRILYVYRGASSAAGTYAENLIERDRSGPS